MTEKFAESLIESLIESYKAELLKEVGGSIYQVCKSDSVSLSSAWIDVTEQTYNDAGLYPEYGRRILYTSDQLAAAILKATKPLVEEVERLQEEDNLPVRYYQPNGKGPVYAVYESSSIDFVEKLRNQLTVAQEELRSRDDFIAMLQETQKDQLAKAEQRVAEACALYIHSTKGAVGSINMAEAVLSGEWRKFMKEV